MPCAPGALASFLLSFIRLGDVLGVHRGTRNTVRSRTKQRRVLQSSTKAAAVFCCALFLLTLIRGLFQGTKRLVDVLAERRAAHWIDTLFDGYLEETAFFLFLILYKL